MNNEIKLRIIIPSLKIETDVMFDERLSFKDNLVILSKLMHINLTDYYVYDAKENIFLKKDVLVKEYQIEYFLLLYLL